MSEQPLRWLSISSGAVPKLAAIAAGVVVLGCVASVIGFLTLRSSPRVRADWLPEPSDLSLARSKSDDGGLSVVSVPELDAASVATSEVPRQHEDGALSPLSSATDKGTASPIDETRQVAVADTPSPLDRQIGDSVSAADPSSQNAGSGPPPTSVIAAVPDNASAPVFAELPVGIGGSNGGPSGWGAPSGQPVTQTQALPSPSGGSPTRSKGPDAPKDTPPAPTAGPVAVVAPVSSAPTVSSPPATDTLPPNTNTTPQVTNSPGATPNDPIKPVNDGPTFELPIPASAACAGKNCQNWQFFDPVVAIGYNYELRPTVAAMPLTFGITGIKLPTKIGDGKYELFLYDVLTQSYIDVGQEIDADPNGSFDVVAYLASLSAAQDALFGISDPEDGLTRFSIRGIDPNAGINPDDLNAFITGLLFSGEINGNLFITPLALDTATGASVDPAAREVSLVSEPDSLPIFAVGLLLLLVGGGLRQRRQRP
jgi:hypothetical protein